MAITPAIASIAPHAHAKVFQGTEAFLSGLAGSCPIQKTTHYLTAEQLGRLGRVPTAIIVRYQIACASLGSKWVYFDSHRVRTQSETLAIVIGGDSRLEEVRVLSFDEPEEYLPKPKWFQVFTGKGLSPSLALQADIPMITGATLSARSATEAVRRTLSIHREIGKEGTQ